MPGISLRAMPVGCVRSPQLPAEAVNRLRQLEGPGRCGPLFTSDLSVNEFLLIDDAGFEPLGLVVGSSIYHVGIQVVRSSGMSWASTRCQPVSCMPLSRLARRTASSLAAASRSISGNRWP